MKNVLPTLLTVFGLIGSGVMYAIYRKDKEIEKNCACNKSPAQSQPGNTARVANVHVNGMSNISGVGGGRSASDIESVRPRGIAVMTSNGTSQDNNSALFDNRITVHSFSRMNQWDKKLRANLLGRSAPVVNFFSGIRYDAWGRVISNEQASETENLSMG